MRKRKELQGLAIVDVSGGRKLGSVGDLVVSPENGRIVALTVSAGMFGGADSWVAAEDVRAIGADAVTVEAENVARPDAEMPHGTRAARDASRALIGKKVVTEHGTLLGAISDYFFDETAMRVTGLTIGGGLLSTEDGVAADRIVSVGPDAVIVTDPGAERRGPDAAADRPGPWAS
jgi:uncharacterized protein YrrD